ncbi:MAG: hypothetical protein A3I75_00610 [Deltaproteobacteria bacterium RIFCSPLOWO2_02_FULL_50_16]|nr:MAG: hypothetical protein A2053_02175 [Deltaproteobacteria bacterium GWA2_50_8]OGQ25613.1 MAG: hypothetical protein A3B79_00365 [Deltaproteobacteria bacterium RIFCSPHIGHO2_02_FULL_50_15]OGQ55847.1 MAG: hypothetical protein A3I75_00610 [Deltaproteobacteria bacterium RIFCSPLOWO2_02_FULL_50_16]OGQ67952.1 MAG: hypothetical protein A3F89_03490 [Deltaproteobacteria bacterium RIFCSPLOWO2_12_FULL_50_11]
MSDNLERLKKLIITGVGAALMTEEGIRHAFSEITLPQEAKKYLINQAARRKQELATIISRELKGFLNRINIHEEVKRALNGLSIDVEATIHLTDKSDPAIKTKKLSLYKDRRKTKIKI